MRNTSMSQTITLNTKAYQWSGFTSADYGSWRYAGGGLASEFSYLTNQVKVGGGKQSSEIKWNLAVPHIADEECVCVPRWHLGYGLCPDPGAARSHVVDGVANGSPRSYP